MNKVLVTGAMGFIGGKITEHFLHHGADVEGWDLTAGNRFGVEVQKVDMTDVEMVQEKLAAFAPDVVIHCAGSADVGVSVRNPEVDYQGNVTLTHNLLFALHKLNMHKTRFVFLSSASVYGNPASLPITEDMPLKPMSPYALHKVMCEVICKYFVDNYDMDIRVARIFSAYGKGLKKQIFWDMYQKAKNTGRLDMFGTGNESRDYIHVDDAIRALYLIATNDHCDDWIFNVANGEEITIRQATEMFAKCVGLSLDKIGFNGVVREGDPLNWRADISKLEALGYKKCVQMSDGLAEYHSWVETV